MRKIMFNDRYGLTQAVIEGRKTMTRRLVDPKSKYEKLRFVQPCIAMEYGLYGYTRNDGWAIIPKYKIGEVVAVAQSYNSFYDDTYNPVLFPAGAGWGNKMFVKAELMPYQIRITGIKCERLQDISDAECMKEGVVGGIIGYYVPGIKCKDWSKESYVDTEDGRTWKLFPTPREAFATLIDKVSGRGAWARNPWVVAYEFELVK
nr:MAG TPA: ASCH domain protein [Caudoviricetes sp.]